jgi:predicted nucleic acid-binding protein
MFTKKTGAHLFIDTNVLLNFFAYSKDDLDQLDKLLKLIHAKAIRLYLTEQVVKEFSRNRDAKLAESFAKFRLPTMPGTPSFMLNLDECKAYMKLLNTFEKSHSLLTKAAKETAGKRELAADKIFASLVQEAKTIEISDELISAAERRHKLGNPPGKNDSIGDQLNWEILLKVVPSGAPLHIVSKDGDYTSRLNPTGPNTFLADEWKETHESDVFIYEHIGQFFQANFPDQDFSLNIEKREAIDRLLNSGAFASTHSAIALLDPYTPFLSEEETEEVVQGALSNGQVRWIMGDTDVEQFFKRLLQINGEDLSPHLREKLKEALEPQDEDDSAVEDESGNKEGA